MDNLLGIAVLALGFLIFAYYTKMPIMFLFSSMIMFGSSLYFFSVRQVGVAICPCSFFGIIFLMLGLWQLVEVSRYYAR